MNQLTDYTPDNLRADVAEFELSQRDIMAMTGIERQSTISSHLNAAEWGSKQMPIRAMYYFLFRAMRLERENLKLSERLKEEFLK